MLSKGILLGAVASLVAAVVMTGCNKSKTHTVEEEVGEPVVASKQIISKCDVPTVFKVVAEEYNLADITIENGDENLTFGNEFGMDITVTVITPCEDAPENNCTVTPPVDPTIPVEGNCKEGWELNDDGDKCTKIVEPPVCEEGLVPDEETGECVKKEEPITCGEGTKLDDDNKTCVSIIPVPGECGDGLVWNPKTEVCDVVKPLECDDGFADVKGQCLPERYVPYFDKVEQKWDSCLDDYSWNKKRKICILK